MQITQNVQLVTLEEYAKLAGIGYKAAHWRVTHGQIAGVRGGNRWYVSVEK